MRKVTSIPPNSSKVTNFFVGFVNWRFSLRFLIIFDISSFTSSLAFLTLYLFRFVSRTD